jgi:uncharacterized protein
LNEIQNSRYAYSRLRYFKEKLPELPIIAARSLLEVEVRKKKTSVPVGRMEFLFLGPMTFGEFLLANNEKVLWSYLTQVPTKAVPQSLHDKCSELRGFLQAPYPL